MTTQRTFKAIDRRTAGIFTCCPSWRLVAAALLFVAVVWLVLTVMAAGASPLAPVDSVAAPFGVQTDAAPAATLPLTLTVLATNDTWGYLDPCG